MKLISARDSRAPAPLSTENRAPAILRAALEVEDAERRRRDPSAAAARSRTRAARRGAALRRCRRRSCRPARSRAAGSAAISSACVALVLDRVELDAELLDLLRARAVRFLNRRRVLALPLRARDLVARRVLLALQPFELGNQRGGARSRAWRSPRAPCRDRGRGCAGRSRTVLDVIANECGIEHATSAIHCIFASPRSPLLRCVRDINRPQSRLPRRRPRHPVSSGHQGAAEGNAAARRQADHSVRRRGGGRVRRRQHHPRHRPRQERDRGSLRRLGRARDRSSKRAASASSSTRSARSRT